MKQNNWLWLTTLLIGFIALSFGVAYLLQDLGARFNLPLDELAWLAYLSVFGTTLVCNSTIIVPVPVATAIMIATATRWDPIAVAFFASIGGTLGELSGYYAGYLGKRIAVDERMVGYDRVADWMHRYGLWAIFLLALQPVLPFDVGGLVAGASKMPLYKFLPALWAGKFLKYIALCYSGIGLIHFLPFWSQ